MNEFPLWSVKSGKLSDNEWGTNVEFSHITDSQWNTIHKLVKTYTTARPGNCPTAYISESNRRIQFRFGHCDSKPVLMIQSGNIDPVECKLYLDQLIECAEVFHKYGLGFWWLDRQLLWKGNGKLLFIPSFWLPAFSSINSLQAGMPPEYAGSPTRPLSQAGDIYTIASLCFRVLTGKEFNPANPVLPSDIRSELNDWDSILDPALRRIPARRPTSFETWKHPDVAKLDPMPKSNRRSILRVLLVLFLLILCGRNIAPGIMRQIPLLNLFAPKLYQRGTGSCVVRYADRSYDRAKWKMVWSIEDIGRNDQLYNISGWDANNLAVGGTCGAMLRDGQWLVQNVGFSKPFFTDAKTFYAFNSDSPTRVYRFDLSGHQVKSEFDTCNAGFNFCQLDRNYFQFWGHRSVYGETFLYEYTKGEFSKVSKDEKKIRIWRDNTTYDEDNFATNLEPYHSFGRGKALAFQPQKKCMVRYRNGLWYEHYETTHEDDMRYGRNHLWAMDEENFILVSNSGMITQFRRGKESHPTIAIPNRPFYPNYPAVWGVSMNKFWVLDCRGNVAQFDHVSVRHLISGPKLNGDDFFRDAWVSPEGVVYAITEKEVYRLD